MQKYNGHYPYNKLSIISNAPDEIGVYFCGYISQANGSLATLYVGRAKGENVTIKSRLLNHLNDDNWPGVNHFGFIICQTPKEAENLETLEIQRLKPNYNTQGK